MTDETAAMLAARVSQVIDETLTGMSLDDRRARDLRHAGKKATEWRARRDELIRVAYAEGASLREIADAVGMSNPGVLRVVRKAPVQGRDAM